MAPRGTILASVFLCRPSVIVMAMSDHHHPVVMVPASIVAPAMIAVPAVIAMHFAAHAGMVSVAMPDHDGLGTGNRRCRDGDQAKRRDNVSELLHLVLLHYGRIKHRERRERSLRTAIEF